MNIEGRGSFGSSRRSRTRRRRNQRRRFHPSSVLYPKSTIPNKQVFDDRLLVTRITFRLSEEEHEGLVPTPGRVTVQSLVTFFLQGIVPHRGFEPLPPQFPAS